MTRGEGESKLWDKLAREGVSEARGEKVVKVFTEKIRSGVPPHYAMRHIQVEILIAKRETRIDGLVDELATRYKVDPKAVAQIIARDLKRLRDNPRLLVQQVIENHHLKLVEMGREAYERRRAATSPLAAALVRREE